MNSILISIYFVAFIACELLPWIQLRSRGFTLSFKQYQSRIIKKTFLPSKRNRKLFETLETIRAHELDIDFQELDAMYLANVDFKSFVDAAILAKEKKIKVTKDVLREMAYANKDLFGIINATLPEGEIRFEDVFMNKRAVLQK
jgi:uncharacterized protein YqfA (UPF0365 family)